METGTFAKPFARLPPAMGSDPSIGRRGSVGGLGSESPPQVRLSMTPPLPLKRGGSLGIGTGRMVGTNFASGTINNRDSEVEMLREELIQKNKRISELERGNGELTRKMRAMEAKILELEDQIRFYERLSEDDKMQVGFSSPRGGREEPLITSAVDIFNRATLRTAATSSSSFYTPPASPPSTPTTLRAGKKKDHRQNTPQHV